MAQLGGHADLPHQRRRSSAPARASATSPTTSSGSSTASSSGPVRTRSSWSWPRRPTIPVINGLTLREHPCQALADVFTIEERLGRLPGASLAFVGDGNNVYHSLALVGAALGMEIRLAHPPGYAPNERIVARATELAAASGGRLVFGQDPREVVRGADSRLHRRLDVDGPGGRDRGAPRRLPRLPGRRRPARRGRPRRRRDALPARPSRRGDHLRGDGRTAEPDLRPVREPPPRPEGAAGRVPGREDAA